jgi:hypothetical protein
MMRFDQLRWHAELAEVSDGQRCTLNGAGSGAPTSPKRQFVPSLRIHGI